ncbi:MAG: hypothetical protein ACC657_17650, partial [Thiohalomonadales bacterium]
MIIVINLIMLNCLCQRITIASESVNELDIELHKLIESKRLIVSFKKGSTNKVINYLDKRLPIHSKKSLKSELMFLYKFSSMDDLTKAKIIFKDSHLLDNIAKENIFKLNPGVRPK